MESKTKQKEKKTDRLSNSWEAGNGNQSCKADWQKKKIQKFEGFCKHGEKLEAEEHHHGQERQQE